VQFGYRSADAAVYPGKHLAYAIRTASETFTGQALTPVSAVHQDYSDNKEHKKSTYNTMTEPQQQQQQQQQRDDDDMEELQVGFFLCCFLMRKSKQLNLVA
jgi:hypothetical protein